MPTCIIIGGGPAGLFAAVSLGRVAGLDVLLLEGQSRPGRKLLLTGAGRCNLTNTAPPAAFLSSYGGRGQGRFLRPALHGLGPEALMSFFRSTGMQLLVREDGKVFPASLRAQDVLNALLEAAREAGARIVTGRRVAAVQPAGEGFVVKFADGRAGSTEDVLAADCVVLAAGGSAYPETGSRGDGVRMAQALGHRIERIRPALTPLRIAEYPFAALAGLALRNVRVTLWKGGGGGTSDPPAYPPAGGRKGPEEEGDLLFAHRWISGPAVLRLSRWADPGDLVTLNWSGTENSDRFLAGFPDLVRRNGGQTAGIFLSRFGAPKRFLQHVLRGAGVREEERCGNLSRERVRVLGVLIAALPLRVKATVGFHAAMVTAGGVALAEVDPKSMESRLVPGLFFAGEVLDIDGDTGGFNLQAAFSTAALAARTIRERYATSGR